MDHEIITKNEIFLIHRFFNLKILIFVLDCSRFGLYWSRVLDLYYAHKISHPCVLRSSFLKFERYSGLLYIVKISFLYYAFLKQLKRRTITCVKFASHFPKFEILIVASEKPIVFLRYFREKVSEI